MSEEAAGRPAVLCHLGPLPSLRPLGLGRSVYVLPIAGQPLYSHIIARVAGSGTDMPCVSIGDPALLANQAAMADLQTMAIVQEPAADTSCQSDGVYLRHLGDDQNIFAKPWEFLRFCEELLADLTPGISDQAEIEPDVEISGNVRIEAGTKVYNGARIKGNVYIGQNCMIGNNAMIRGSTSLAAGSAAGFTADIKNSILMERCGIGPLAFVADSLIDRDFFFGGTGRVSNYRLDGRNIEMLYEGERHSTGRRQFGVVIGENTKIGIGSVILPGRKIGANCLIGPNVIVTRNIDTDLRIEAEQTLRVSKTNK